MLLFNVVPFIVFDNFLLLFFVVCSGDKKAAFSIITAAKKAHYITTQAKQKECSDEAVSLKEEEQNVRNIASELASIQAANAGTVQTKTVTRMVTKNVTKMVTKTVIKIVMQQKKVIVLKQKLEFKGVTAEALNTAEIRTKLEQELKTQLDIQAPSTLKITSIDSGKTLTDSLIELTAAADADAKGETYYFYCERFFSFQY